MSTTQAVADKARQAARLILPLSLLISLLLSESVAALFAALSAVLLHEAGHLFCFLVLGLGLPRLSVDGGGLRLTAAREVTGMRWLGILLGGPLANLLGALLFYRTGAPALGAMHLSAALFNLLPIGTTDGGRLLSFLIGLFLPTVRAQRISNAITLLLLSFFFFFGLLLFYMTGYGLIAVFFSLFCFTDRFKGQFDDF